MPRHLEEHADDGHHGQAAVGKLGGKLLGLLLRIRGGQDLEAVVSRSAGLVVLEATAELHKAKVGGDLRPSCHGHLGHGSQPVRDVREFQPSRWGQEAWP